MPLGSLLLSYDISLMLNSFEFLAFLISFGLLLYLGKILVGVTTGVSIGIIKLLKLLVTNYSTGEEVEDIIFENFGFSRSRASDF